MKPQSRISAPGTVDDASIHVCSLLAVHDVLEETRARYLVTVINEQLMLATPHRLDTVNHLKLACNDIARPMPGLIAPDTTHIDRLIGFARHWNRQGPLVVHCWAGISRSTAAAFVTACVLNPDTPEAAIARDLRAASPSANPNRLLIELGDAALGRAGRMLRAVEEMGEGEPMAIEGKPFRLPSRYN